MIAAIPYYPIIWLELRVGFYLVMEIGNITNNYVLTCSVHTKSRAKRDQGGQGGSPQERTYLLSYLEICVCAFRVIKT